MTILPIFFFILLNESPIKNFFVTRTPHWVARFVAEIKSPLITAQLKKIPNNKIEVGKNPTVRLEFVAKKGINILVMHVDSYYQSYLSIYENTLTQSGYPVILGQYPTWEEFSKHYQATDVKENTIRVQIKGGLSEDYALFFLREDHQIIRAKYFENKIEIVELSYEYKQYSEKNQSILLPQKIQIHIFHPKSASKKFFVELIPLQVEFLANE